MKSYIDKHPNVTLGKILPQCNSNTTKERIVFLRLDLSPPWALILKNTNDFWYFFEK